MRVSVIIPCYRQGHFLSVAVESALLQTHNDVEVIVVNDGSDDDTDEVAKKYGDRIRYIHQQNRGLPLARNAGIEVATGDYLLFLDADDAIPPQAIEQLLRAVREPGKTVAVGGFCCFEQSPEQLSEPIVLPFPREQDVLTHLIQGNYGPPHCFLVPAELIRVIGGFEPSLASCEDWDCWIRLVLAGGEVIRIAGVTAYYRMVAGSMSKNLDRMLACRSQVLVRMHRAMREQGLLADYGQMLSETASRVIRRFYARRLKHSTLIQLQQIVQELSEQGFRPPMSVKQRCLHTLFGWQSEKALMTWHRLADRSYVTFLANGYT